MFNLKKDYEVIFKGLFNKFAGLRKYIFDIAKLDGNPATDEQPPYTHCLNCGAELSGMYCHKCGQEATLPIPKIWGFVKDYIKNITCIDRQALPTLYNLVFHPGRLVKDYCAGRYRSYSNPIQLNLFIVFVLIILFSAVGDDTSFADMLKEATSKELFISESVLSTIRDDSEYMHSIETSPRDTVVLVASHNVVDKYKETVEILDIISLTDLEEPDTLVVTLPTILRDDRLVVEEDGKYYFSIDNDKMDSALMLNEIIEVWMALVSTILGNFQLLMFLTVPFLAYSIRLVLIRRKFPRIYCFIFSLYYIAFVEILIMLLYVISVIFNIPMIYIQVLLHIIMFVYLMMALKQTYDIRTWLKSAFAALFVNITYGISCMVMIVVISIIIICNTIV